MRKLWLVSIVLALITGQGRSQETIESTPHASPAVHLEAVPPARSIESEASSIVRDPHSTKADLAVPLCPAKFDDSLESTGIANVNEKKVSPPKATFVSAAPITDEARKLHHLSTDVILSLIIDEKGKVNNSCIVKSAGYGLDASAAKAASESRFKPARAESKAVPYRVTEDVQFRTYF